MNGPRRTVGLRPRLPHLELIVPRLVRGLRDGGRSDEYIRKALLEDATEVFVDKPRREYERLLEPDEPGGRPEAWY